MMEENRNSPGDGSYNCWLPSMQSSFHIHSTTGPLELRSGPDGKSKDLDLAAISHELTFLVYGIRSPKDLSRFLSNVDCTILSNPQDWDLSGKSNQWRWKWLRMSQLPAHEHLDPVLMSAFVSEDDTDYGDEVARVLVEFALQFLSMRRNHNPVVE